MDGSYDFVDCNTIISSLLTQSIYRVQAATRNSWKNLELSDQAKNISVHIQFSKEQFEKLKIGLIPQEMEDKWFIFFENDWLYIHRSLSGMGIYKAKVHKVDEARFEINDFWVEQEQNNYAPANDKAAILNFISHIIYLIDRNV